MVLPRVRAVAAPVVTCRDGGELDGLRGSIVSNWMTQFEETEESHCYEFTPLVRYDFPDSCADEGYTVDCVQSDYDAYCGAVSWEEPELDAFVSVEQQVDLRAADLVLTGQFLDAVVRDPVVCNPSLLRTNWYPNKENNPIELLRSANVRNFSPPYMMRPADIDSYSYKQLCDWQLAYGCDNVLEMFDFFALQPILPSEQRQSAWISKQSGRKLHKYCDEFKDMLCSNISTNYDLSQK